MSNSNPEPGLDDTESVRTSQQSAVHSTGTKKKSGFVITSVTDSGHGRPSSIVRDGEESADDLDESHASYSDVSYSRTTDADHDQESTASEDTLNISAHELANAGPPVSDVSVVVNHSSVTPHHHSNQVPPQQSSEGNLAPVKSSQIHDPSQSSSQISVPGNGAPSGHVNTLNKQHSENLESPQELPHDNTINNAMKEENSVNEEKKVDTASPPNSSVEQNLKVPTSTSNTNGLEPSHEQTSTTVSSTIPSTTHVPSTTHNASSDVSPSTTAERPTVLNTAVMSTTVATSKTPPVTSTVTTGNKAPGTRVYKVVKRDTHQPSKRNRGRWNWYDFSDNQSPMIGFIAQSMSDSRISHESSYFNPMGYSSNIGPYVLQPSDSSSSVFKEQLYRTGFSSNNSFNSSSSINWDHIAGRSLKSDERDVSIMAPDALKTAMKKYALRNTGDSSTGDMSAAARSLKIDNKIEAAMDLVKKHLMSAVRDEVDELKEKIKDLQEENNRLKSESQLLRANIPADLQSQIQSQLPLRKDSVPKDTKTNSEVQTSSASAQPVSTVDSLHQQQTQSTPSSDLSTQKGTNHTTIQATAPPQGTATPHMHPVIHSTDNNKVKVTSTNATHTNATVHQQRQDASKMVKNIPITSSQAQAHVTSKPQTSNVHPGQGSSKMAGPASQKTAAPPVHHQQQIDPSKPQTSNVHPGQGSSKMAGLANHKAASPPVHPQQQVDPSKPQTSNVHPGQGSSKMAGPANHKAAAPPVHPQQQVDPSKAQTSNVHPGQGSSKMAGPANQKAAAPPVHPQQQVDPSKPQTSNVHPGQGSSKMAGPANQKAVPPPVHPQQQVDPSKPQTSNVHPGQGSGKMAGPANHKAAAPPAHPQQQVDPSKADHVSAKVQPENSVKNPQTSVKATDTSIIKNNTS